MERVGIGFSGGMPPPDIVDCVKLAEELGYESAWVAEGHGGDQFAILTACAVATSSIKLGTSITSVFVRTAPTIAMAAATVDHFSNGRFILGLGSSHKVQVEPEHGLEFIRPIERMRECTDIVRGILRDSDIQYKGSVFNIERFDLWFEPVRREMPIYFAAVRPRMLEICGEVSDGVILTWCTLEHAATAVHHLSEGAKRVGRDPQEVDVSTLIACAVSDDRNVARDELRRYIASYVWRFPRYRKLVEEAGFEEEVRAVAQAWREGRIEDALNLAPRGARRHRGAGRVARRMPRKAAEIQGSRDQASHSVTSRHRSQCQDKGDGSNPGLRSGIAQPRTGSPTETIRRRPMTTVPVITGDTLKTLKNIPTQTLIDGLWVMGWPMSFIHGAKPLQPGQHMAGRAVTLRFVPHRPDLASDKPKGADSAE